MPQSINLNISNQPDNWIPPSYAKPAPEEWQPPDYARPAPVENDEKSPLNKIWDLANKPLVNITPEMRQAMDAFKVDHPIAGALGEFGTGMLTGNSAPLQLGLEALTGGASILGKEALRIPGMIAGTGMGIQGIKHGFESAKEMYQNPSWENAGKLTQGVLEGGLGLLGAKHLNDYIRMPSNAKVPIVNKEQQIELPIIEEKSIELKKDEAIPELTTRFIKDETGTLDTQVIKDWFNKNLDKFKDDEEFQAGLTAIKQGNWSRANRIKEDRTDIEAKQEFKAQLSKPTLKKFLTDETGEFRFSKKVPKPEQINPVLDKLIQALNEVAPKRNEQEALYSLERAKRIAAASRIKTPGIEGHYQRLGKLKGELPKVNYEGTKLSADDIDVLANTIQASNLQGFEKIRATEGLIKLIDGTHGVPQQNELNLLRDVFGKQFDQIIEMHGGLGGRIENLAKVANFAKTMRASIDVSAPLRQGLPLIHKVAFWKSLTPMIRSLTNKEYYDSMMQSIHDRPNHEFGQESGLKLTDFDGPLNQREEAYGSFHNAFTRLTGVDASERAFTGFINKLRSDTFDTLIEQAKKAGVKVEEISKDKEGNEVKVPTNEAREIAKFVNNATGRGDLGKYGERIAVPLNAVFFSPRLIASRLTILNPNYYIKASPFVRQEALKSLFAITGASVAANSLLSLFGSQTELDPRSSDFAKSRFGNTRVDPNAGFQQYIVAATRLITGQDKNSTSGKIFELGKRPIDPTRTSLIFGLGNKTSRSLIENKLSPLIGFVDDIASNRKADNSGLGGIVSGNNYGSNVINTFTPMMINDIIDIAKDDPSLLPLAALGASGMGLQTYQAPRPKLRIR